MSQRDILLPQHESGRLAALRSYDILDTPAEAAFDRITRLAGRILDTPISLVSLVDAERQWFKSRRGLEATQTPRDISFCTHAITRDEVMVVADALQDPRFTDNPLVRGDPKIRFYAGAPLKTPAGHNIGTLCVIDREPRRITEEQKLLLADLAHLAIDEMELRLAGKRAIEELRTKEAVLQDLEAVLSGIDYGVLFMGPDLRVRLMNEAYRRMWGVTADFAASKPGFLEILEHLRKDGIYDVPDAEWDDYVRARHEAVLAADCELVETRRSDGTILEFKCTPLADGGRMLTYYDVTERKKLERTKDEIVTTVSHELRTPITSIKGSLGLLRGGTLAGLPETNRRMIDIAYQNSDRLLRLVNEFLDIEKIDAGKNHYNFVGLDLESLLREAIDANRGFSDQHGVELELRDGVPNVQVRADHDRLIQVMTNLLSNAVKFSPEGGCVSVSACLRERRVRVLVSDQGPGIPEDFRANIFEKFAQADTSDSRRRGGTGLGLSISRAIVEDHGGVIGFETEVGKGTTFYFDLPLLGQSTDADHGPQRAAAREGSESAAPLAS